MTAVADAAVTAVTPLDLLTTVAPFVSRQSLALSGPITLEAGANLLLAIHEIEQAVGYWQGDLFMQLEEQHGRDAISQVLEASDYTRVRQHIWVCERCPPDIRQPSLSYSHHRAVGACETVSGRADWLQRAADEQWTVAELRAAMGHEPKQRHKLDTEGVLRLSNERIGQVWTEEDDLAVRAAMGAQE